VAATVTILSRRYYSALAQTASIRIVTLHTPNFLQQWRWLFLCYLHAYIRFGLLDTKKRGCCAPRSINSALFFPVLTSHLTNAFNFNTALPRKAWHTFAEKVHFATVTGTATIRKSYQMRTGQSRHVGEDRTDDSPHASLVSIFKESCCFCFYPYFCPSRR
jgi:hypothetical protein